METKRRQMQDKTATYTRMTHAQKDQFEIAIERYSESKGATFTQQQVVAMLIKRFCGDQGVKFSRAAQPPGSKQDART